jgi:hypothetical protein
LLEGRGAVHSNKNEQSSLLDPRRIEMMVLGFACGFAFDYWWRESWLFGLAWATWISLNWQIGRAEFKRIGG